MQGLYKRGKIWYISKSLTIRGHTIKIRQSTGVSDKAQAEVILANAIRELTDERVFGTKRDHPLSDAAEAYLKHIQRTVKVSTVERNTLDAAKLVADLGDPPVRSINQRMLQQWIDSQYGILKSNTVKRRISILRAILKHAAMYLYDDDTPWLDACPELKAPDWHDERKPRPLSWSEQDRLFALLPGWFQPIVMMAVYTGMRDQELCGLRWEWEATAGDATVFILPAEVTKNGEERLVPLNDVALSIVEGQRGNGSEYVFTAPSGERLHRLQTTSWKQAVKASGLPVRIHDLRHTFGSRLRNAGVSLEDRKALLGHTVGDITTHYSAPEIESLREASNQITRKNGENLLRKVVGIGAQVSQIHTHKEELVSSH